MRLLPSLLLVITLILGAGCSHQSEATKKRGDVPDLKTSVEDQHRKMRWGLWEEASVYLTPTKRQEFLGRYEEKGEDFRIVDLEIKKITFGPKRAEVEVEQEWYDESMVVRKERFVELWTEVDGAWLRADRLTRKEFRAAKKAAQAADTPTSASSASAPSSSAGADPAPEAPEAPEEPGS